MSAQQEIQVDSADVIALKKELYDSITQFNFEDFTLYKQGSKTYIGKKQDGFDSATFIFDSKINFSNSKSTTDSQDREIDRDLASFLIKRN